MPRVMIADYPHRLGGHCGSGALRDLVDWAGLGWNGPPTEALIFGLSGGLDFHWMRLPGSNPAFYLGGRTVELELDLCRRLGIDVERRQTDDASEGWTWITDELHAGRPVMIWADILRLPYLRVRLTNTCHDIVVTGYDTEKGVAYVADNDRKEIQEVPLEDLAKARDSSGFPVPNRHGTFPMRFPERLPDLLPLAREAAAASAANLGPANEDPLADLLPDGVGYAGGLTGIRQFASDIARWPDDLAPETLTAAHRSLAVFIEKAGTGGGLFRRLQAGFCREIATRTGDKPFEKAADAYTACAKTWTRLAATGDPAHAAALPALEEQAAEALTAAAQPH